MSNNVKWSVGIIKATLLNPRSLAVWPDNIEVGQIAEPICIVTPMESITEQDEMNAQLIACAPELLEALIFCKSVIESNGAFELSEKLAIEKAESVLIRVKTPYSKCTP